MPETIDELREAVDSLEQSDEELREWLRGRGEAELLSPVTKPARYGGSGVGEFVIHVGQVYYIITPTSTELLVSRSHPNTEGEIVPATEADSGLLRSTVSNYPQFLMELVKEVNDSASKYEAAYPVPEPGDIQLDE